MGDKIFLVGHGRQYMSAVEGDVPAGVVVHFAVAQGYLSTGTVSKAHLRGELTTYTETITGPAKYPEHYLCADLPDMNLSKLIAFKEGISLGRHTNSWMLATRGATDVRLSLILARLKRLGLTEPIEFIWTCCRSPINKPPLGKYLYEGGIMKIAAPGSSDPTPEPGTLGHNKYEQDATGVLTVLHQSDIHKVGVQFSFRPDRKDQLSTVGGKGDPSDRYSPIELFGDPKSGNMGSPDVAY
jgi:hypothetical protein